MPHLLIIADEFAELKKEQPDFVRALVSAARVGRSLGINLILATQKPRGVVDDEIWSNTRFRICLRVADKQDSNEMLKRTDAAYITGTGRGFLQVGNDEIFDEFQSGWSGAPYTPEVPFNDDSKAKAVIIGLTGKPEAVKKKKKKKGDNVKKFAQLDAMVQYAANLAEENHIKPLRQIWLPPLPGIFYLDDLELTWDEKQIKLPVGLADDPQNQRQFPVYLDFIRDGHLLICGSAGSGKTSLVQTILYGAALPVNASQGESMMLAIREKLKPLTENGISGARKLGTDLTMTDSGEFLEKINFRDLPDNTFVMGEQEGMFQTCDLDQTLCFTVCGSGKTGKTNFLKYTALQMKKKGAEVYVFDGCLKEMEEFSRKNELDGYRALRQFGSWKQGIHLGGAFDEQGIFDYEVTPSERSRTYPAGAAFTEQEGKAVLFMTPFVKEGKYE